MNIAYILSSSKALGGASKAFKTMLVGLMQKGVCPVVVLPEDGPMSEWCQEKQIPYLITTFRFATYPNWKTFKDWLLFFPRLLARQWVNERSVRFLARELKACNIELIHTNVGVVDIGYRAAFRLGIPHIYHIREYADLDFNLHYFPSKRRFRSQLSLPSVYSICITRGIQRHHGQDESLHSRVIYDGIRSAMSACPSASQGDYFLYAGRIEYTKGLDILLQAYALCRERGLQLPPLWVAGRVEEPDYMESMLAFVQAQHLKDVVHFLGERPDIDALMQKARVLIVPSRYEGFGLCMPEAMFTGCPVIAHDTAGTHEQLENGLRQTGEEIAYRFTTAEQLADNMQRLMAASPDELSAMTARAFSVVNKLYTAEAHCAGVFQFYQNILEEQKHTTNENH